jgi:hypothetical protein
MPVPIFMPIAKATLSYTADGFYIQQMNFNLLSLNIILLDVLDQEASGKSRTKSTQNTQ